MTIRSAALLGFIALTRAGAATPVLTRSYDNARTSANLSETVFAPDTVGQRQLKRVKILDIPDDPRVEAQPLYVPGIQMKDNKTHNVVFVCSMGNTVYAFDADAPEGQDLIYSVVVEKPYRPALDPRHPPNGTVIDMFGINILWGILSTPVIDMDAQGGPAMYVVNWVAEQPTKPVLKLHALRLKDGKEFQPALPIQASITNAAGKKVSLHADQKQRAALLLVPLRGQHKTLYVATAGGENPGSPNGWMVAFDVDGWRTIDGWVATPGSFGGGMWQAGQGPSADDAGNVYAMTGNGGYISGAHGAPNTDFSGKTDFAESFVKLALSGAPGAQKLTLVDWFMPFQDLKRRDRDQDLGSGAPILPPDTDIVLGAGKDGVLYVMDRNNMGKVIHDFSKLKSKPIFFTYFPGPEFSPTGNLEFNIPNKKTHHLHGSPVFWNSGTRGPMLFDWGENECLRAWTMDASGKVTFVGKSTEVASSALANPSVKGEGGMPGGMLALSADGKQNGIVWATAPITGNANQQVVEGIIRAYDAVTLDANNNGDGTHRLKLLWDSGRLPANDPKKRFAFSKFCPPMAVDGKLFVTTYGPWPDKRGNHGRIDVYALK
jgi:hypothetical protein